jgi:hypothetical protein
MPSLHCLDFVNNKLHKRAKPVQYIVNGDCWECVSHVIDGGYPRIRFNDRLWKMSRLVYEIYNNKSIEAGFVIMHSCDNPKCINPSHLSEGTSKENNDDKMRKGRYKHLQGEETSMNKLTEKQVRFIREDGVHTIQELSNMFEVHISCIKSIKEGRTWGWLDGEIDKSTVRGYRKVSEEDRLMIIEDSKSCTREELSKKYNTSISNIYKILRERRG